MLTRLPVRAGFGAGLVWGALLLLACRVAVNKTPAADWLVAPLILADTTGAADAIVVPGAGVITACVPNNNSLRRALLAARLWRERRAPLIVFSGGTGSAACPVATAMAQIALDAGVPAAHIRTEAASRSTRENGEMSAPLLRAWDTRRLLVVTDRLHMRRTTGVFEQLGFTVERASVPIYEGHTDNVSMLFAGLREMAALVYYRARGWVGRAAVPWPGTHEAQAPVQTNRTTVKASPTMFPAGPVVILGASYAQGWKLDTVAGIPIVNRGVAGQQSFELLARFDVDVVGARPRAVILWGFINDVFRAAPGETDAALARTFDNYVQMVARAKQLGIEPILSTEVTARPTQNSALEVLVSWVATALGKDAYQDAINRHVLATNRRLRELAHREGLLLLDFQPLLAEERTGRRRRVFAQPDGSHVTDAGYATLTSYAGPVLERHFAVRER